MRLTLKQILSVAGLVVVGGGAGFYFMGQKKPDLAIKQPRNSAQAIKSGLSEQKSIPITVSANGYVAAIQIVDVRPQIQNVVRAVHVKEGQDVRAGQLLFTLDTRSDSANVDKAQAQIARDRADLADAENTLRRNQDLLAKNFVSQAVVDTARSKVESLRAAMKADQAAAQSSAISLSYNQIKASINGRIGAISVHPGSLAQAAGPALLTIAQIDPIAVTFSVPEQELAYIRATYPNGDATVVAQLPNNQEVVGKLIFIDNASDTQSGTIRMKAQFANSERKMWPGSFVNVRLVTRTLPNAVVVPAQAIVTGPVDKSIYAVQADDTVKLQKIDVLTIDNGQAAIAGIGAGVRIVIEGTQNLRAGAKVKEMQSAPAENGKNINGDKKAGKKPPA